MDKSSLKLGDIVTIPGSPYCVHYYMPGVWWIEDDTEQKSCIYIVEGADSAVVIDTGVDTGGDLFSVVEKLTDLPWKLIITHGHPDHACFLDRVDEFWMNEKDEEPLLHFCPDIKPYLENRCDLDESTIFDLGGGTIIKVIEVPGHTLGSVMFCDTDHNVVFSGDAFGSGSGVWMQVPGALDMSDYRKSALHAIQKLDEIYGDTPYMVLGGHHFQIDMSPNRNGVNLICRKMMVQMAELCEQTINGTAELWPARLGDTAFTNETVYLAVNDRACAVCLKSKFK